MRIGIVVCLNIVNKDFAALCKTNRHLLLIKIYNNFQSEFYARYE